VKELSPSVMLSVASPYFLEKRKAVILCSAHDDAVGSIFSHILTPGLISGGPAGFWRAPRLRDSVENLPSDVF
jgi:hypothetical protein